MVKKHTYETKVKKFILNAGNQVYWLILVTFHAPGSGPGSRTVRSMPIYADRFLSTALDRIMQTSGKKRYFRPTSSQKSWVILQIIPGTTLVQKKSATTTNSIFFANLKKVRRKYAQKLNHIVKKGTNWTKHLECSFFIK